MYFVVRNDASHSDILFKTDDATWEAYNQWGGNSFYTGNSVAGSQGNPSTGSEDTPTNRAVYASYNRPLLNRIQPFGLGLNSQPLYAEYPMVRWMERNGYDVSYFTDVDTDLRGAEIKLNGVYAYGAAGTFPSNTFNANNYWVDVVFTNSIADTTPPAVTGETPAPASGGVVPTTPETATFSESVQASTITFTLKGPAGAVAGALSYTDSNHTATFTPAAALSASTTYTATVSGAKDLAGNVMTAPVTWSFTTGSNAWTQSTVADFSAGTPSNSAVISENGGQIQLTQTLDDFPGSALGSAWTTTSWASAGGGPASVTVSNSILSIGGSQVASGTVPVGTPIEANLSFAAAPYQHFGLATGLAAISGNYWVLFSTMGTTNTLFARVDINGTTQDISLGALPTGFHDYAIQPVGGGVQFYVDGVLRTTITATIPGGTAIRAAFSEYGGSPLPAMQVDWVRFGGFASSGTFISSVFNAGKAAAYASATWNAAVPTGTTLIVQLRTSSDGINWSSWQTVGNGTAISPTLSGQYLQYDVIFTTTDPSLTSILNDITINWS